MNIELCRSARLQDRCSIDIVRVRSRFTHTHVSGPDESRLGVAQPYQPNGHPHALASSGGHGLAGVSLGHELRALALSHTTPVRRDNA